MSKVSIIIPIYNVEKYLAKCLDYVINQTYKDLEIICVNDESPDNSAQILEEYATKDNRIKIVNRKNGGLSAARNSGLEVAAGEYCYFIDSDDWIELDTIEKLVNIMRSKDVDAVVHSASNIPEDDSCIGMAKDTQNWLNSYAKQNGIYDVPVEINRKISTVTWNKLYKMEIINKYNCRFPEGLVNEDELFLWTYMIHCKNYYYLDEKLYNYLRRSDSIMGTRDNSPKVLDILKIEEEIYKTVEKYKNIEEYQEYLTQNYVDEIKWLFQRMPKRYRKEAVKRINQYYKNINHDKEILELYRKYKYKKLKQFIQGIFSITNIKTDNYVGKQLKLFGLKFKFKNKYKTLLSIIDNKFNDCENKINSLQDQFNSLQDQFNSLQNQVQYTNDKFNKLYHTSKEIANTDIIPNKIVFNNMTGNGYGCNPKYIAEEIIRQKLPYELVWLVKDVEQVKGEFPKEIKLVEWTVENAIREFSSAKVWISNQRMPQLYENGLFKKKDQYYLQTWHGAALKQIEKDVETEKQWWCKWAKVDSQYMDLLLTAGKTEKEVFERNFYFNGEILENGLPRDSVFYQKEEYKRDLINKVYGSFNIPQNKKIVLYVPTFRDDGRTSAYNIDCSGLLTNIKNKFNNDYVLLLRLHPNVPKEVSEIFKYDESIINATFYPDVEELMLASDVLITDYSSCMFDYMLSRKPIFLYMPDLEQYKKDRNFYINFEDLPFSIAENNDNLYENIEKFNSDAYLNKLNTFIKQFGYCEKIDIQGLINRIKATIEEV